jgi:hypothetical protein
LGLDEPASGALTVVQRIALLLGSLAASAVLTIALVLAGYGPAATVAPTAVPVVPDLAQAVVDEPTATPQATTQVDTVYVKPAPSPKTIRIVKAAPTKPPVVIHKVVRAASSAGTHETENEREGAEND